MKKKVIGFIILLLVYVLGLSINCYAYTWEEFKTFVADYTNYSSELSQGTKDLCSWFLSQQNNIQNAIGIDFLNNSVSFYMYRKSFSYGISNYFIAIQGTQNINYSGGGFNFVSPTSPYSYVRTFGGNNIDSTFKNQTGNYNNNNFLGSCGLMVNEPTSYDYFTTNYFQDRFIVTPSIEFIPYNDGNISVFYNGSFDTFLKYNLSRSVKSWSLGRLDGFDDTMKIDVKLNRYMNSEFTTLVGHAQLYNGKFTTFGGLSIASDGVVFINNDSLYYEQGYYLTIDLDGENILNYPIYFVPYASTLVSGDLLSPDIDTNSDLEILQNLQELVNIQNIGSIYDSNFSGDSGEVLGFFGYNDYNNQYSNYLSDLFGEVKNTLIGSGDVTFTFPYMSTSITLHSNDFITPNNGLKVFVRDFLIFGYFVLLYKSISRFYHRMQEGNVLGAVNSVAVDDESLLM